MSILQVKVRLNMKLDIGVHAHWSRKFRSYHPMLTETFYGADVVGP